MSSLNNSSSGNDKDDKEEVIKRSDLTLIQQVEAVLGYSLEDPQFNRRYCMERGGY